MKSWKVIMTGLIVLAMTATPLLAQRGPGGQEQFQEMDTDGDNQISQEEWISHQTERFTEIDSDGDGFASETEMETHHQSMGPPRGGRRGGRDN